MRAVWLLGASSLALLWMGGQGVYQALTNRSPVDATCAGLEKTVPSATWLRVKGCTGLLTEASYKRKGSVIREVYIPVHAPRPEGATEDPVSHLVVATADDGVVALMREMAELDKSKDAKGIQLFMAQNAQRIRFDKDVEGMVRWGIDSDDKVLSHLRERRKKRLAEDFVVLDEGQQPALIWSATLLGGGIILGVFVLAILARSQRR